MKQNNKKADVIVMLLGTLATSLLGNMFTSKGKIPGWVVTRVGAGTIRAGQDF